jgi:hypothetical protein
LALSVAIVAGFFSRPKKRTPAEVAGFIRDFLEGRGGEWDWDDFTSVPLVDPKLEAIRLGAASIALPVTVDGMAQLKTLLSRAEILKTEWLDASQPE